MFELLEYLIWFGAGSVTAFMYLFVAYIFTMEAIGRTPNPRENWKLKWCVVYPFLIADILVNMIVLTVWFADMPRQLTVTSRLKRWRKLYGSTSYSKLNWMQKRRLLFSVWLCDDHLDHYDKITGDHC